jgi:pimeloyl-ACP methyl ester carboxylesterase
MQPTIRYAKSDHVHVAYQVFGDGAVDLVFVPGFISHLENWWSEPGHARWMRRLGESARVIQFDKRGTGLSDRVDPQPGMDDVRAVMDAAGVERRSNFSEPAPVSGCCPPQRSARFRGKWAP